MAKKLGGRPAWEPTDEERQQVERAVAIGYTQAQIAQLIGKSEDSLQKHCRTELDSGKIKVDAFVVGKLMEKIGKGDTASIIFYLKTRMGWREVQDINLNASVTFTVERTHRKGESG